MGVGVVTFGLTLGPGDKTRDMPPCRVGWGPVGRDSSRMVSCVASPWHASEPEGRVAWGWAPGGFRDGA